MARVLKGSHRFIHTPTLSSATGMSHTCLCLPSYRWYSFTDPGGMEGWVGLGGWLCRETVYLSEVIPLLTGLNVHVAYRRFHCPYVIPQIIYCYCSKYSACSSITKFPSSSHSLPVIYLSSGGRRLTSWTTGSGLSRHRCRCIAHLRVGNDRSSSRYLVSDFHLPTTFLREYLTELTHVSAQYTTCEWCSRHEESRNYTINYTHTFISPRR